MILLSYDYVHSPFDLLFPVSSHNFPYRWVYQVVWGTEIERDGLAHPPSSPQMTLVLIIHD